MDRALIDTDILSYYFKGDKKVTGNFRGILFILAWLGLALSLVMR